MPKKTLNIIVILKQLTKPQLLKLATKKKAKIPKSWTKTKIVQTLATITTPKDLKKPKTQETKTTTKLNTTTLQKNRIKT